LTLSAAQLRVETAAYWAKEITCKMAERTRLGQPFGSLNVFGFLVRKVALRLGTENSITAFEHDVCAPHDRAQKSLDHFTGRWKRDKSTVK
jgi:hypothetical protein